MHGLQRLAEHWYVQLLLRFARDRSEAEDMLQEGFIRVYRDMAQFRSEGALGGWIRRIMVNTALSHLRKQKDFIQSTPDYNGLEHRSAREEDIAGNMDAESVRQAVLRGEPFHRFRFVTRSQEEIDSLASRQRAQAEQAAELERQVLERRQAKEEEERLNRIREVEEEKKVPYKRKNIINKDVVAVEEDLDVDAI
jgi:RNA polymerase sigma-70 factor (ECF subfamily)